MASLIAIYFCILGEYAKVLQNEAVTLEAWLANKGNWQHLWRESVSSHDSSTSRAASSALGVGLRIPADIAQMVRNNESLIEGLPSSFDRRLGALQSQGGRGSGGNGGKQNGRGAGKRKQKGGNNGNTGDGDKANDSNGNATRKVTSNGVGAGCRAWERKPNKKQKKGN